MKHTFALLTFLCVTSFSSAGNDFNLAMPEFKSMQTPTLNELVEVEPGRRILFSGYAAEIAVISIADDVIHQGSKHGTTYSLIIPAGTLTLYASNNTGKYYRSPKELKIHWNGFLGGDYPVTAGIFVPNRTDQAPEIFYGKENVIPTASEQHPDIKFKFEFLKQLSSKGFTRELVYQGISKNVISIIYREYMNDMIRTAYSEDLKFDLADGSVIAYKGARFEIIKAGNLGLTYKIIRPFSGD